MEDAQQDIDYLQRELNKLKNKFDDQRTSSMDDLNDLKSRMDKAESGNASLRKAYGDLESLLKSMQQPEGGANQDQVDRLNDELARLRAEFEQHRDYAQKHLGDLIQEMPHKADKQDMIDMENRLLDKLREMIEQFMKQFANKEDVMKRLL